jgi:glutaredoxin
VKEYLSQKNITYVDYDVAKDQERLKEMLQKSGQLGTPVILVNDDVLIGFSKSKLDKLLSK